MDLLGNIIWLVCGGFVSAVLYIAAGGVACCTIIGIPFGLQAIKLGVATLAPFGREIHEHADANSVGRLVCNVLWALSVGWCIAIAHVGWALLLALTVIGIPFAVQHLKLAPLALMPFGRELA